ncbi:MAG: metallophosphoesterase [Anaerolineales bacterium]|nr:metallophosphoesterase [Anaerolineales bacterium]
MNQQFAHKPPYGRWIAILVLLILLILACRQEPEPWPTLTPGAANALPTIQATLLPIAQAPTDTIPAPPVPPTVEASAIPTLPPPPSPTLPPPTPEPTATPQYPFTSFAVIGDYGSDTESEERVADLVLSWDVDFVITTGDNNYPEGAAENIDNAIGQYYHSFIYPYRGRFGEGASYNRFFPSLGNHDVLTDAGQPYYDYFDLPGNERYYDFTWGPLHLFALNNNPDEPDGVGVSSAQAAWLQERLAASTLPWKIVYMHYSPYSSGPHGSTDWSQWPYAEWGATAVLAGHNHMYERLDYDGIPYFVNGLGGASIYNFNQPLPWSIVRYNDDYGAMLVEATADRIVFQFITWTGEVIDLYAISAAP